MGRGIEFLYPQQTSEGLRQQAIVSLELFALVAIHFNECKRIDKGAFSHYPGSGCS